MLPSQLERFNFQHLLAELQPRKARRGGVQAVARARRLELAAAIEARKTATRAQQQAAAMTTLKADGTADAWVQPRWRLAVLPTCLQVLLLGQCMFQGLVVTMIGRYCVLEFGVAGGLSYVLALWLPTTLMSVFVKQHVDSVVCAAAGARAQAML